MKARSVLFSGASFFESSSSFTKILTARLSRFICNDVTTTTTQELRDALEAKGLDSSGLKAVLLSRLEESLEGGEGGGEEEKEEEEAEEEPLSAVEIEEKEKEPTPEPESEAPATNAVAAAAPMMFSPQAASIKLPRSAASIKLPRSSDADTAPPPPTFRPRATSTPW